MLVEMNPSPWEVLAELCPCHETRRSFKIFALPLPKTCRGWPSCHCSPARCPWRIRETQPVVQTACVAHMVAGQSAQKAKSMKWLRLSVRKTGGGPVLSAPKRALPKSTERAKRWKGLACRSSVHFCLHADGVHHATCPELLVVLQELPGHTQAANWEA